MSSPIEWNVGDRLLVSAMDDVANKFDDKVFEVVITEFSPSKLYVKMLVFNSELWFATDKLKVREQLDQKMSWFTGTV